jgi:hypothetical protein
MPISRISFNSSFFFLVTSDLRIDVFSTMQHSVPVVKPAKLANIHSDLKSQQKNGFAAASMLIPHYSSRKKDRVAMCYHFGLDGVLVRHDIEMKPADGAPSQLSALVTPKYRWDMNRTTKSFLEVRFKSNAPPSMGASQAASQLHPPGPAASSSYVHIDLGAGFTSADHEALAAKQLLANAEIETSDSKTADKPFWQSPVFRLVAWTELPQGLHNDVANMRPSEDDPSVRSGRKAELLLQNDAAYVRTPSRLIPRPRLDSAADNDALVQKFAAASVPMSSGRRASNPQSPAAAMGAPVNVFEGIMDDDLSDELILKDKRRLAQGAPVAAAPGKESPVLKPHVVHHAAPAPVPVPVPAVAPAVAPAPAPAPVAVAPKAAPAPAPIPAIVEPAPQPSASSKKKKRKGKGKVDSSALASDDDDSSRSGKSSASSAEQDVSQSTFLLQDALN